MKLSISLFLTFCISTNIHAQHTFSDTAFIVWDISNKIKWDDFKSGKIDTNSRYEAECTSFFKSLYYLKNDSVFCRIQSFFNSEKSWKKPVPLNNYDLNHEQLHFDITEIFARKIRQQIIGADLNQESEATIQKVLYSFVAECESFQNLYDDETDHSKNKIKQEEWKLKIEKLLLSLDEYKDQTIYVKKPICKICWK